MAILLVRVPLALAKAAALSVFEFVAPAPQRRVHQIKACFTGCGLPAANCQRFDAHTHEECNGCGVVDAYSRSCSQCRRSMRAAIKRGRKLEAVAISRIRKG